MTLNLLQLFVKLANKEFSSCVIIKHLLFDYHNYILNGNSEVTNIQILTIINIFITS